MLLYLLINTIQVCINYYDIILTVNTIGEHNTLWKLSSSAPNECVDQFNVPALKKYISSPKVSNLYLYMYIVTYTINFSVINNTLFLIMNKLRQMLIQ